MGGGGLLPLTGQRGVCLRALPASTDAELNRMLRRGASMQIDASLLPGGGGAFRAVRVGLALKVLF